MYWDFPLSGCWLWTHLLLFSGVLCMIFLLWREYSDREESAVRALPVCVQYAGTLRGDCACAVLGVQDIWYELFSSLEFDLYRADVLGADLKVTEDIRFRMEQRICERMSIEDRLTA